MDWLGTWENQNKSRLEITRVDLDRFYGTFQSTRGRAVQDQKYPVSGSIQNELIAFVVNFSSVGSIVSFSGRLAEDGSIHTLWTLVREYADEAKTKKTQPWNSFTVNSDLFRRLDSQNVD